jgi:hypothetical protein
MGGEWVEKHKTVTRQAANCLQFGIFKLGRTWETRFKPVLVCYGEGCVMSFVM